MNASIMRINKRVDTQSLPRLACRSSDFVGNFASSTSNMLATVVTPAYWAIVIELSVLGVKVTNKAGWPNLV